MQKTATFLSVILLFIMICIFSPVEILAAASWINSAVDGIISSGRVEILKNSRQKANFHFDLSGIQYLDVQIDGNTYSDISIKGEGSTTRPDMPKLPAVSRWVVIPNGTSVRLIHRADSKKIIDSDLPPVNFSEMNGEHSTQVYNPEDDQSEFTDGLYPPEPVTVSSPVRMRNVRLAQVTVYPVQYNVVTGQYIERSDLDVELQFVTDHDRSRGLDFERIPSPDFQRLVESIAVNPPPHRDNRELVEARGYYEYYLFVMPESIDGEDQDSIYAQVYRLMEWKRRAGNKVDLLEIPAGLERSGNRIDIQIQNYYDELLDQGIEPFDNILLIGEEELNPQNNNAQGQGMDILLASPGSPYDEGDWRNHWDLFYAYLEQEGEEPDLIPDAAVSRFQAGNIAMLANGVNKSLSYDSEPYMEDTTWFNKAVVEEEPLLEAGNTGTFTVDYFVQVLENNSKNVVEQFRQNNENSSRWVGRQITNRIGFLAGRAQNEQMSYHRYRPDEYMEAVGVFPIAILTSGHGEAAMEALFWVGREFYADPGNYNDPSGAKGAVAVTCTWAIPTTTPNNCLGIGMMHSMLDLRLSFGWARNWSLMNLSRVYADDPENAVLIKYSSDFQLSGEPGIRQWEGVPSLISVIYPQELSPGDGYIPVSVNDSASGDGIANVRVTLYKGTIDEVELFDVKYTDSDGNCFFVIDPELEGPIQITALEQDIYPFKGSIERVEQGISIIAGINEISDAEGGNGDGIVNLNETIQVSLSASNVGNETEAVNVVGIVRSLTEGAVVAENRTEFGNIAAGATSETLCNIDVTVSFPCSDGKSIALLIDFESDNGNWSSAVTLDPQTESLRIGNLQAGGLIEHGEQQFNLELFNSGRVATSSFTARLVPSGWGIVFPEGILEFNAIQPGQSATANSDITVIGDTIVIPGARIPVRVILEYDGVQFDQIDFELQVGTPGVGDPLGPDNYGYYAFDNTDTEYEQCPGWEWIEIYPNSDEADIYGEPIELDHGNNLDDFATIQLPFTFQYYGVQYDTIMVSTNGFIVMGKNRFAVPNRQNWPLEGGGSGGPSGMLAPYWENLSIVPESANIYYGYDPDFDDVVVIEWYRARLYSTDNQVTFQVILRDPAVYPTITGDGEILFGYYSIEQYLGGPLETPYASVGITSPDATTGLAYSTSNTYDVTSAPLANRRMILFTTNVDDPTEDAAPGQRTVETPTRFDFMEIYPNPFNSSTSINFSVDIKSEISLKVFDLNGRLVGSIIEGEIATGNHSVEWVANDLATGLYLVNLTNGKQSVTRKIALIR